MTIADIIIRLESVQIALGRYDTIGAARLLERLQLDLDIAHRRESERPAIAETRTR